MLYSDNAKIISTRLTISISQVENQNDLEQDGRQLGS